jgi:hypothetical protein
LNLIMNKVALNQNSLEIIQDFLDRYKKSCDFSRFKFEFRSNPAVFMCVSQLPDLWSKTRTPFDKNQAFFKFTDKNGKKVNHPTKPQLFPK